MGDIKKSIKYRIYRYKFYLDASHYIYSNEGNKGVIHPHTWEFAVELKNKNGDFVMFNEIEKVINDIFEPYQESSLNEKEPFNKIVPTLENIGEYFKSLMEERMEDRNWEVLRLEVSETPSRSYIIM